MKLKCKQITKATKLFGSITSTTMHIKICIIHRGQEIMIADGKKYFKYDDDNDGISD